MLAQACGIDAPVSRLVQLGRQNSLLVKRFDRESGGGRIHFASARTLLLAEGIAEEQMSYADIAEVARRYSPAPLEDCLQMFRRMVLNILIENTDDHAKNHAFLHQGADRWRLSPVYDVQPQLQGIPYQQLIVGDDGTDPTLANALSQASRFMLTPVEARAEVEQILEIMSGWREAFLESGVCERDIRELERFMVRDSELPPLSRSGSTRKLDQLNDAAYLRGRHSLVELFEQLRQHIVESEDPDGIARKVLTEGGVLLPTSAIGQRCKYGYGRNVCELRLRGESAMGFVDTVALPYDKKNIRRHRLTLTVAWALYAGALLTALLVWVRWIVTNDPAYSW
ncbi:hypothetical protein AWV79_32080 [Cupriavidus sp. UYMMa02A]|nr:hypothetical protein AWV79_32080 [Cupriavidus sp. UYMMa02A]